MTLFGYTFGTQQKHNNSNNNSNNNNNNKIEDRFKNEDMKSSIEINNLFRKAKKR